MREIRLTDTRSGELRAARSRAMRGHVGIYACGPTVYGRIHVGNARPFVIFSLLKRFLEHEGYEVDAGGQHHRRQRQDLRRRRERRASERRARREMTAPTSPTPTRSGSADPTTSRSPRETIEAIVDEIAALIDAAHAYVVDGDVYFRVRSDAALRQPLAPQLDDMDQGEGVEGASARRIRSTSRSGRRHKPGEDTHWTRRGGAGGPGWHIECSAMAEELLGVGFDIHGGGSTCCSPTTRTRPRRRARARRRSSRGCGCTTA